MDRDTEIFLSLFVPPAAVTFLSAGWVAPSGVPGADTGFENPSICRRCISVFGGLCRVATSRDTTIRSMSRVGRFSVPNHAPALPSPTPEPRRNLKFETAVHRQAHPSPPPPSTYPPSAFRAPAANQSRMRGPTLSALTPKRVGPILARRHSSVLRGKPTFHPGNSAPIARLSHTLGLGCDRVRGWKRGRSVGRRRHQRRSPRREDRRFTQWDRGVPGASGSLDVSFRASWGFVDVRDRQGLRRSCGSCQDPPRRVFPKGQPSGDLGPVCGSLAASYACSTVIPVG